MPGVLLCCCAHQAHRGAPLAGVLLCKSAHQSLKGSRWVGSYSVVQCIRHLMGQPLYCSAANAGMWGQRGFGDGSTPIHDLAVSPCFHGCWAFLPGISYQNLLPHIPSVCLSAVNSCPHLGIAPQSLNSSSQPLHLPGDLHPCLRSAWLQQGEYVSPSI